MVTITSSALGAHSNHTVFGAGSSRAFSSASAPRSVTRSASSTTTTCQRRFTGATLALETSWRISSTPMLSCSVRSRVTSGWAPDSDVRQSLQRPQPPSWHWRAAANARAALERPDPGGPTNNHAWVMACLPPATARRSVSTALS